MVTALPVSAPVICTLSPLGRCSQITAPPHLASAAAPDGRVQARSISSAFCPCAFVTYRALVAVNPVTLSAYGVSDGLDASGQVTVATADGVRPVTMVFSRGSSLASIETNQTRIGFVPTKRSNQSLRAEVSLTFSAGPLARWPSAYS